MSERPSEPSSFLNEIDRRLRAIQAELAPGRVSRRAGDDQRGRGRDGPLATILERDPVGRPPTAKPESEPEASTEVTALTRQVESMTEAQAKLLAASERLLETFDRIASSASVVTVSAGPFGATEALREFERALAELPGVGRVAVRGYEGADRAILDVELARPAADRRDTVP